MLKALRSVYKIFIDLSRLIVVSEVTSKQLKSLKISKEWLLRIFFVANVYKPTKCMY